MSSSLSSPSVRRVLLLAVGFWLCFAAYGCAQMLQSSVNGAGDVGLACLAGVYIALALSALAAPLLLSLDARALTAVLPLCAAVYALMVAANIDPAAGPLLASCVCVGLAAAVFWSAQSLYVQRAAAAYARERSLPLTRANSYMNSVFFSVLSSSGIASAAIATFFVLALDAAAVRDLFIFMTVLGAAASLLLAFLPEPGDESSTVVSVPCRWLCTRAAPAAAVPAAAAAAAGPSALLSPSAAPAEWQTSVLVASSPQEGEEAPSPLGSPPRPALAIPAAPAAPAPSAASPEALPASPATPADRALLAAPPLAAAAAAVPTPLFMLRFLFSTRRMRWTIPLILEHGMMQGLFNGAVLGSLARSDGLASVCIISALFSLGATVSNLAWHGPLQRPSHGRRWAFVWAFAAHAVFVASLLAWSFAAPPPADAAAPPANGVGDPRILAAAAALVLVYSVGDTIFFSQIPATLQTFFPARGASPGASPEASCAMASIRLFSSAGNAASTILSILLGPQRFWMQYAITLAAIAAAAAATRYLHARVCSLDGGEAPAEGAAEAAAAAEKGGAGADATARAAAEPEEARRGEREAAPAVESAPHGVTVAAWT